jgi:Na+/H+ antiporter NhaC/CRP-like cAMP-binding protein
MPKAVIDDAFLARFFDLTDDEAGREECAVIRDKLERLQFSHGEDVCRIDEEPDGMFFLESGICSVLNRDGDQINIMREGQYFGEYGVLSGQRRLSTVRSVGRTVVYKLGGEDMMEILGRHPNLYGELMKQVYAQVTHKHTQLLKLSQMRRGILQAPANQTPMSLRSMILQYGILALIFILTWILVPEGSGGPVFLLPLGLMVAYVLITKRTLESLAVSGMLAAMLLFRSGLSASYTDALMESMKNPDNVFTVLVMALMGGVITLVEASGAVTALQKMAERRIHTPRGALLGAVGVMAVTAIDDCLNMLCAATSIRPTADEHRVPREKLALLLSFLPTVLCSFLPFSLWGIFVIGTIGASVPGSGTDVFCRSIPFNFFSILAVVVLLLFSLRNVLRSRTLRKAEDRVASGGKLWPPDSERYLPEDEPGAWGLRRNLLVPVITLAVTSLAVRSLWSGSLVVDSACGLVATLIVLFFLYCCQGLMSPEQFAEHLVSGIQSMVLPIMLYLMTMCFSALLEQETMDSFFSGTVQALGPYTSLLPAMLFLIFTLLTVALGSSWAMYVIGFPLAIRMAAAGGIDLSLCIGAVCAAGIAGEKNCVFTSDALSVGSAIGMDPRAVLAVRLPYSISFTVGAFLLYLLAGHIL